MVLLCYGAPNCSPEPLLLPELMLLTVANTFSAIQSGQCQLILPYHYEASKLSGYETHGPGDHFRKISQIIIMSKGPLFSFGR